MTSPAPLPIRQWILVPGIITLAITLVRLVGELLHWSPTFFSRAGGGAGAVVGIVWLVPIFGIYFARRLGELGERPASLGKAFGLWAIAMCIFPVWVVIGGALGLAQIQIVAGACLAVFAGVFVVKPGWPALAGVLWAYGLAARIPVILVMLVAIFADWGTHYDVAPPGFPVVSPLVKCLLIGVFPQLTLWMGFTVVIGMLFGLITIAVRGRKA